MHACSLMLVIASVFIFTSSAIDYISFDVIKSIVVHPREEQTTPKSDEGTRRKRWISLTDSANIINKVNSLRGSVGASNMNYLTYDYLLDVDASNWTQHCQFYADFYSNWEDAYVAAFATRDKPAHIPLLEEMFKSPKFYNPVRSVYLRTVGAGQSICFGAEIKGQNYSQIYITAYAFSRTSNFNENRTQFVLGEQCTTCLSGSYWCDNRLCRDDCSGQISTCTCYTSCTNCRDWSRRDCTCPSQPFADAITLNCSKRETGDGRKTVGLRSGVTQPVRSGGTPYKAASWAMIVVSTLAFFRLQ